MMHVGLLRGNISVIFSSGIIHSYIPLAFNTVANWPGLFNITSPEERRKTSHMKNKKT